ncbi:hypothetical protein H257_12085 [Aphanomyces astaci]|uniref:DDE Tnp4 domain-containing protein n=1 Tax=Aphanomyces astaci TaxID=112090 RepID=W4G1Z9_APHAT|nr:hypothetical protein H257_12085 [Aphanomyces astaci]ETV73049.1 hypothetical protein H257_12085 [Aphanomyces astaci]|eukprot:XP_009837498.1 hypothetical protein H257_12085 [Aphanomyces astaci]
MALKERHYLTSPSLIAKNPTPWATMYAARDWSSFVTSVSLDPETFDLLLVSFAKHYPVHHLSGSGGRPPKINSINEALSLVLHFYSAPCEGKTLCALFGMPPATLARTLHKAELALSAALKTLPTAGIRYPTKRQQREWGVLISRVEPLVRGVWGFLDGKNYPVKAPTAVDLQNAY